MMTKPSHLFIAVATGSLLLGLTSCTSVPGEKRAAGPKYVFFFLGDGMSSAQIQAAEAFKAGDENSAETLLDEDHRLHMTRMPVTGRATTFSDTRFITDSAAAVTAFACGVKTAPGVLGRNTALDKSYRSVAELAQEQGRAIGILSSVSLSHATPAGYYANVNRRSKYAEIGYQAAQSGFDFFGGGRFPKMDSHENAGRIPVRMALEAEDYTILTDKDEIFGLRDKERGKVICSLPSSYDDDAMPFAIDRPAEYFSLAEITQAAINYLSSDPEGFFIMVEGGKIDWAGHANDIATMLNEVIAFDDAIGVALDFLERHPEETLVVVTSDHDTGGLALGFRGTKYQSALSSLKGQTKSAKNFTAQDLADYRKTHRWNGEAESNIDDELKQLMKDRFGLLWEDLSAYQREMLEKAYDASLGASGRDLRPSGYDMDGDVNVDYLTYGGGEPLTVMLTRILAHKAGLEWSSYGHTAVPAPVFASGAGAKRFIGSYDNTDIAKKLAEIMGFSPFPIEDAARSGPSAF